MSGVRPSLNLFLEKLRHPDWSVVRRRLACAAFFAFAFVLAFRWTFPVRALKERLILEASAQGWQVDSADVGPAGIVGMRATDVLLEDQTGTKVALDEISVSLRLLPLLVGRRSVAFDVRLWDGRIHGTADVAGDLRFEATMAGLDLARALPLRQALRLELLGTVNGSADVSLGSGAAPRPRGRIDVEIANGGINGGQLPLPGMSTPLTIPKVGLGRLTAQVVLGDGKGTFDRLEARDGDAEVRSDSLYFVPQPGRLAASPLYGRLGVRIADAFLDRPGNAAFKGLLDLALRGSRGKDGFYQLQLYGSLGSPQARPIAAGEPVTPPPAFPGGAPAGSGGGATFSVPRPRPAPTPANPD